MTTAPSPVFPPRLRSGDLVRVIAPSRAPAHIPQDQHDTAAACLGGLGLRVEISSAVREPAFLGCATVERRLADLHGAFADPSVHGIMTVIGGWNVNRLLGEIDWGVIAANPKPFCGYSDISALQNAIFAKTGLVTYSGPYSTTFAMKKGIEYTLEMYRRCLMTDGPYEIEPAETWSDDAWYMDQENRTFRPNPGPQTLSSGRGGSAAVVEGTAIGGNLCTLNLLQGTPYMPSLDGAVLFVEEDDQNAKFAMVEFARNFQSLLHLPSAEGLRGIVIGRFQPQSTTGPAELADLVADMPALHRIPVACGFDFGHTTPHFTFPIGGRVRLDCSAPGARLGVIAH